MNKNKGIDGLATEILHELKRETAFCQIALVISLIVNVLLIAALIY